MFPWSLKIGQGNIRGVKISYLVPANGEKKVDVIFGFSRELTLDMCSFLELWMNNWLCEFAFNYAKILKWLQIVITLHGIIGFDNT